MEHMGKTFLRLLVIGFCFISTADASGIDTIRQRLMDTVQAIQTLEATFSEKGPQREATGRVYLKRPQTSNVYGKLKFVYDPPHLLEIISLDGTVYVWNKKNHTVDDTPLSSTPLFIFLRSEFRLGDAAVEKSLIEEGEFIQWAFQQSEDKDTDGPEVTLTFQKMPGNPQTLQLVRWVLIDASGNETRVSLQNVQMNRPLSDAEFQKPQEDEDEEEED